MLTWKVVEEKVRLLDVTQQAAAARLYSNVEYYKEQRLKGDKTDKAGNIDRSKKESSFK